MTPGQRLAHLSSKAPGRLDDLVQVLAKLGQGVLGGLAVEAPELMDEAPRHGGGGPDQLHGPMQAGLAVDDVQQGAP